MAGPEEGRRLILVNSLGTDARIWDEVIERLGGYRILAYDKRGHGASDSPPGPYGLDDHIGDLVGLADHEGWASFALAGISVGGLIAQGVALRHPRRVNALILCDTVARFGTPESWDARIAAVEAGGMQAIADALVELWFTPAYRRDNAAAVAGWRNILLHSDVKGYAASCATLRDTDLASQLGRIDAPTLVVAGDGDRSTPAALVRQTAALIPRARFEIIPGAGHIPAIDQPERLAALIEKFLTEMGNV